MISRRTFIWSTLGLTGVLATGALVPPHRLRVAAQLLLAGEPTPPGGATRVFAQPEAWAKSLIGAAESQIGRTVRYDPAYTALSYPNGDVPIERGVCTDVIIRAYRDAFSLDLQKLVHEDMRANFKAYPKTWGLKRPDRNIDHRRVLNLEVFFRRKGAALDVTEQAQDYLPGDVVSQRLPGNLPHISIVTHRANVTGDRPLVVHNIGAGTRLEDNLFSFKITGHFRFKPA